jgi:hypothetical protein
MRQATGIMAGGTISAILGFSMDATTAAVSARAGLGRPSGRCGIVGRSQQKVWPTDGQHIAPEPAANSVVNAFPFRVIATEVTPKRKGRRPMPAFREYSIQSDCTPANEKPRAREWRG